MGTALLLDPMMNLFMRILLWEQQTWNATNVGLCPRLLDSLTAFVFLCNVQQSDG